MENKLVVARGWLVVGYVGGITEETAQQFLCDDVIVLCPDAVTFWNVANTAQNHTRTQPHKQVFEKIDI